MVRACFSALRGSISRPMEEEVDDPGKVTRTPGVHHSHSAKKKTGMGRGEGGGGSGLYRAVYANTRMRISITGHATVCSLALALIPIDRRPLSARGLYIVAIISVPLSRRSGDCKSEALFSIFVTRASKPTPVLYRGASYARNPSKSPGVLYDLIFSFIFFFFIQLIRGSCIFGLSVRAV